MTLSLASLPHISAVLCSAAILALAGCRGSDDGLSGFEGKTVEIITNDNVWRPTQYGDHLEWTTDKRIIGQLVSVDQGGLLVRTSLGDVWMARGSVVSLRMTGS